MNNLKLVFDGYAKWLDSGNCTFEQIKVSKILKYKYNIKNILTKCLIQVKTKSLKSLEERINKLHVNSELLDSEDLLRNEVQKCVNDWNLLNEKYVHK